MHYYISQIENQHLLEAIAVIFDKNTSEWFPVLLSIDRIFIDKQKIFLSGHTSLT